MSEKEDVSVTTIDNLSDVAHTQGRPRKLSEYKATNTPLSASEIAQDEAQETEPLGWAPRSTENIADMKPLPEK
jgi:hypothetical protein